MWLMRKTISVAVIASVFSMAGCKMNQEKQKPDFSKLTEDFVYGSLALSPVSATQAGYHEHQGIKLDEKLDDFSPSGIETARKFDAGFHDRLAAIDQQALSAEERADYQIIENAIELSLLDLQQIRSYRHNPTIYVELVGNALCSPFVCEYATLDTRYRKIIQRLSQAPVLMDQAKMNLIDSAEVWTRVAREENDGNIDLIDKTLRAKAPANLKADFDKAAGPALDSLRSFNSYLKDDLSKRTSDWRLGKERYSKKFAYTLIVGKTPEEVLSEAEAALKETRQQMTKLAAPHSIREALDSIAKQHTTPEHFMDEARKGLEVATEFVRQKHLVTFPARSNLQVIPTPEFMRGTYGVAALNAAPAPEHPLRAAYWFTPIPPDRP